MESYERTSYLWMWILMISGIMLIGTLFSAFSFQKGSLALGIGIIFLFAAALSFIISGLVYAENIQVGDICENVHHGYICSPC